MEMAAATEGVCSSIGVSSTRCEWRREWRFSAPLMAMAAATEGVCSSIGVSTRKRPGPRSSPRRTPRVTNCYQNPANSCQTRMRPFPHEKNSSTEGTKIIHIAAFLFLLIRRIPDSRHRAEEAQNHAHRDQNSPRPFSCKRTCCKTHTFGAIQSPTRRRDATFHKEM